MSARKRMKVSVIIGSYRPGRCLYRCINSLRKQTVLPDEIIIGIDSESEREYIQTEPDIPCRFAVSGKTGVSAARNAACKMATGDVLAFIDDDAHAGWKWIEQTRRVFEDESVSCAGGRVIPDFEKGYLPEKWHWIIGCTGISKRPICSNMAIRKTEFDEAGGFPENLGRIKHNLTIGEETELILNLESKGKKVIWDPEMVVYHWCPKTRLTFSYIMQRAYKEGLGKAVIGKKYPLKKEGDFLKYYLLHPDRYTIPVLAATGFGFITATIMGENDERT